VLDQLAGHRYWYSLHHAASLAFLVSASLTTHNDGAGGDKKVYVADPTTKRVVSDPLADELCKQQARSKLRALAEAQREREKQARNHLTRTPPSAREVNQDVARIQRQIEQIRRSRRPGARG
jgi:hypothetical protein